MVELAQKHVSATEQPSVFMTSAGRWPGRTQSQSMRSFSPLSTHHPLDDWRRLGGSYFTIELVEEVWMGDWDIRYWRQPLSASCADLLEAGFLIESIVEPQPAPEMAALFPRLCRQPGFRHVLDCFSRRRPGSRTRRLPLFPP